VAAVADFLPVGSLGLGAGGAFAFCAGLTEEGTWIFTLERVAAGFMPEAEEGRGIFETALFMSEVEFYLVNLFLTKASICVGVLSPDCGLEAEPDSLFLLSSVPGLAAEPVFIFDLMFLYFEDIAQI
jgi:hypothetical protein